MMNYSLKASYKDISDAYCKNHRAGSRRDIRRAYEFACEKHEGVLRKSGEPYINHAVRTARTVAEWGFESDMICAALLHDVVEDCDVSVSEISDMFGSTVARTVDAVTALSDRDFDNAEHRPGKRQLDTLSDARLQRKMDYRAFFVKVADRIDNLNTLDGVPEEKRIPKAVHTREILIPMAILAKSFYCVDILEELCFQIEHPDEYEKIRTRCQSIRRTNSRKCHEALDTLSRYFDPAYNYAQDDMETCHAHIREFRYSHRLPVSIYRQITSHASNINDDFLPSLTKENFPLYDLFLTVDDELGEEDALFTSRDLFFQYFDKVLSKKGFFLAGHNVTTHKDADYYVLADETDNLYRLFVRTEKEASRYLYGNSLDEDNPLSITDVNEIEPRDTYNNKIKVFRRDGSAMMIDEHATVLDFAFYIHTDLGLHFHHALVNENRTCLPPYTRLNSGDKVSIVKDDQVVPTFSWFKYVHTSRATDRLVHYFDRLYHGTGTK